ncbi:MAG: CoA transferase [Pseudomonadota bacterium]
MSAMRGIKVLELSESVSGEYCGKLLSDFGAEVIKLEKPGTGSPTRRLGPFAAKGDDNERSGLFAYLNTNKRSVALDVTTVAGSAALQKLLNHVDVVIDDHASGWLKDIGLDPETLDGKWPKLVLCSITSFGQSPPEDRVHAEDFTVFQASGLGYHTPSGSADDMPPLKGAGRFLTSYEAGLDAALCISASLYEREVSKQGRFIDISKQQVLASRLDYVLGQMVAGDMDVSTNRTQFDLFGPAGIFRCRDGFAYIWMSAPSHWDGLRKLLGDPEWMNEFPERWLERECTPERVKLCRQYIAEWLATQEKEKVAAEAQKLGLILVAVNNAEDLKASPQYAFRKFFAEVNHPVLGAALHPTVPYKLSATPAQITAPAPLLGQHTSSMGEQP